MLFCLRCEANIESPAINIACVLHFSNKCLQFSNKRLKSLFIGASGYKFLPKLHRLNINFTRQPFILQSVNSFNMIKLTVNNKSYEVDASPDMPLLWAIRDMVGLTGTKFGCGIAQCGACTVHVDGAPVRSCSFPVAAAAGKKITTIEGLSEKVGEAVQKAWIELQVPQCGYCQSGQIMSATALLKTKPNPTDADIDSAMQGNLCRCGTYQRVRSAIHRAAEMIK